MDTNNIPNIEPKIDALTATKMLEDIFDESNVTPNTVPVEALAGYDDFERARFLPQRILLIAVIILWLLLPLMFFAPKYEISQVRMNEQNLPVYTVEVTSHMPVRAVEALLNGESIQIYAKDSKTYAVEPSSNGTLEIRVTALNKQTTVRSVEVTAVDDMGPKLVSSRMDDSRVYLQMAENGTGINYESIYAIGAESGDIVRPESYNKETGTIVFQFPKERMDIYIPDKRGNALHLSMQMQ